MTASEPVNLYGCHAIVIGAVDAAGRAVAVALAEAGAKVSLTTLKSEPSEEFQANSILNDVWSLGKAGVALRLDSSNSRDLGTGLERIAAEVEPAEIVVSMPGATVPPGNWGRARIVLIRRTGDGFEVHGGGTPVASLENDLGRAVARLAAAPTL
jgi:NAD(P)-dependent dehydrogenase (short-subunit alcohol dehydrogenase family)